MKYKLFFVSLFLSVVLIGNIFALELRSVKVVDSLRTARANYSSSENITLVAETNNTEKTNNISFAYLIFDPSKNQVFKHTGNSIPGSPGVGGSEVGNLSISRFYTIPGNYTLSVTATTDTNLSASQSAIFSVYSPSIIMTYPPNGSSDLVDQPLVFRWIASGASKYRIYLGDNQSFYNTLLSAETFDTSYSYPLNPADQRQRLIGGQIYYWKVDGLDSSGNKMASTQVPFSFSIKGSAVSSLTRDVLIQSILLNQNSMPPQLSVNVEVRNAGGGAENNITVTLYSLGVVAGTKKIDLINQGEIKTLTFILEPPELAKGQPLLLTAAHDFYDDNKQNNILTAALYLKDEYIKSKYAKLLGRITETGSSNGIENAKITFTGAQNGEVFSFSGGQYKIDGLPEGSYTLITSHPEFEPLEKTIIVEKAKAYANIDFELKRRKSSEYSLSEAWDAIKQCVSKEIINEMEGYEPSELIGVDKQELNSIVESLKSKKAKVLEASVTNVSQ